MRGTLPRWTQLGGMFAAALVLHLLLPLLLGWDHAFGEDLTNWMRAALNLRLGRPGGPFPPLYPLLTLALARVTDLPLIDAGRWVASISGALAVPMIAVGTASIYGRAAGTWAGWLTLTLPNLLAWTLRVDAVGPYMLALGLVLWAVGRGGVLLGLALAALLLTKEMGVLVLPAVLLALGVTRRWRALGIGVLTLGVVLGAAMALDHSQDPADNLTGKTALPLQEQRALILDGTVPDVFLDRSDPTLTLELEATQAHLQALSPAGRLAWLAQLQLGRLWHFLGAWLLVLPLGALALRGRPRDQQAFALGMLLPLATCLVVVVQPRHAELALVGLLGPLGLAATRRPRIAAGITLVLLALGVTRFVRLERHRGDLISDYTAAQVAVAARIQPYLTEDTTLCSSAPWLSALVERRTGDCYSHPHQASDTLLALERPSVDGVPQPIEPGPDGFGPLDSARWAPLRKMHAGLLGDLMLYRVLLP